MAAPKGYVWARDAGKNVSYQNGVLNVDGKAYKQGQYMMDGGKAYIKAPTSPTAPKVNTSGMVGLGSHFANQGLTPSWNNQTKQLKAGNMTFNKGDYTISNGRAYIDPAQLAMGWYMPQLNQTPKAPTQQELNPYVQSQTSIFKPLIDAQTKGIEAAYNKSQNRLQGSKDKAIEAARRSAISRGVYDSGTYSVAQDNTEAAYAPEFENLEESKSSALANATGQYDSQIMSNALNLWKGAIDQKNAGTRSIVEGLMQYSQNNQNKAYQDAQIGIQKGTLALNQKEFEWAKNPNNPENIYKTKAAANVGKSSGSSGGDDNLTAGEREAAVLGLIAEDAMAQKQKGKSFGDVYKYYVSNMAAFGGYVDPYKVYQQVHLIYYGYMTEAGQTPGQEAEDEGYYQWGTKKQPTSIYPSSPSGFVPKGFESSYLLGPFNPWLYNKK